MRSRWLSRLALTTLFPLCLAGCVTPSQHCDTIVIAVSPAIVTLDHTVAGNAQAYTLDVTVPTGCPLPPLPAPRWSVSNTVAATITQSGVASCKAASASTITVSAGEGTPANLTCN